MGTGGGRGAHGRDRVLVVVAAAEATDRVLVVVAAAEATEGEEPPICCEVRVL
jgi:hypothetical protein